MNNSSKTRTQSKSSAVKKFTKFRPSIFSRHPSHSVLRGALPLLPFRSVIRFGSTTESDNRVQINSIQGVRNSSNKTLMKECFDKAGVKTATWVKGPEAEKALKEGKIEFPIVVKHNYGSRGTGNHKFDKKEQYDAWKKGRNLSEYIVEQFYSFSREYRLHITKNGCFYTCRKMLKESTPKDEKWHRHDENSVWILETNPNFNKPENWKAIEKDCVAALSALNLDVAAFDVKCQGKDKKNPDYILIESNSAPSFGDMTSARYKEILPKLLTEKYESRKQ